MCSASPAPHSTLPPPPSLSHVPPSPPAGPDGGEQVELELLVSVSELSLAQRDTVVRQLAALLHVADADIQVGALQGRSHFR